MNLLISFLSGYMISWIPTVFLTYLNYKYADEFQKLTFGLYSFYLFDILFLILFYILNYQKNDWENLKHNEKLIYLCIFICVILHFFMYIVHFIIKNHIEKLSSDYEEVKEISHIGLFFENLIGWTTIYYISLYFNDN